MGEKKDKKIFFDSAFFFDESRISLDSDGIEENLNGNVKSTLFSRGRKTECFFTEDSKLYITSKEQRFLDREIKLAESIKAIDGISARILKNYGKFKSSEKDFLYRKFIKNYGELKKEILKAPQNITGFFSPAGLWKFSIVGAIILGMVSMTFIYRYLGMGAMAVGNGQKILANAPIEQILGEEQVREDQETVRYIENIIRELEKNRDEDFEKKIKEMVKGYPIEKMVPYILEKDKIVAAFLIGIAKKESGWGEHVPVLEGKDCYNYWGYRGIRKLMGTGGHTCFFSRKDAVDTVGKRLDFLIKNKELDTPAKMVIWKCGSACSKDDQAAVRKWISDVDLYFNKLN